MRFNILFLFTILQFTIYYLAAQYMLHGTIYNFTIYNFTIYYLLFTMYNVQFAMWRILRSQIVNSKSSNRTSLQFFQEV